jgi:hypothetical protein
MGCNCKTSDNNQITTIVDGQEVVEKQKKLSRTILSYIVKIIGFSFSIILLPLINVVIVWIMFKTIVLNKNIDIAETFSAIFSKKYKIVETNSDEDDEDENDDEYLELTEDDVVALNVEDITDKTK